MGKYRTLNPKVTHFSESLDPNKSSCYGNAQQGSEKSSGNILPVLKKCQWGKSKKSSFCRRDRTQNLRLILFISTNFLILQLCTSSPISSANTSDIINNHTKSVNKNSSLQKENSTIDESDSWLSPTLLNCTLPSSKDFPADLFTKEQRQHGAIAIHFFALFYMLYALLLVCDAYFVPAIECICEELHIAPNIAGATFMAISTSAPELFTNVIGTFVTKGDLGVGTIVGSAVFNVLSVGFFIGIGTNFTSTAVAAGSRLRKKGVSLDWWSLSRDTGYYLLSVGTLIVVLFDGRVYWYEAVMMLLIYGLYIAGMCYDDQCKEFMETLCMKVKACFCVDEPERKLSTILKQKLQFGETIDDTSPLIRTGIKERSYGTAHKKQSYRLSLAEVIPTPQESLDSNSLSTSTSSNSESLTSMTSSVVALSALKDIVAFPISIALRCTIPDCRTERNKKWCGISLLLCVLWIGGLSYVISWMVCVIGETLEIPDSVSGLTFLAAGTSFPEVLSSVIVARQGLGSMGLSNSVGSNTFDILICLGLPWLIQSAILTSHNDDFISIHSAGLGYSAGLLVTSMVILYIIIAINDYVLDTKVGVSCLIMYLVFITLACLLEMNVFFSVNLPPC